METDSWQNSETIVLLVQNRVCSNFEQLAQKIGVTRQKLIPYLQKIEIYDWIKKQFEDMKVDRDGRFYQNGMYTNKNIERLMKKTGLERSTVINRISAYRSGKITIEELEEERKQERYSDEKINSLYKQYQEENCLIIELAESSGIPYLTLIRRFGILKKSKSITK